MMIHHQGNVIMLANVSMMIGIMILMDGYEDDRADCEDALMNMTTVYHQEGSRFQGP